VAQHAFLLGGTGQIGRAVARRFTEAGWRVTLAARNEPGDLDLPFVHVDRTVEGELEAALGNETDVLVDVIPFTQRDADQVRALVDRVGSVVAISTAAVYTDDEGRGLNDEGSTFPALIREQQRTVEPGDEDYATRKRAIELTLLEDERLRATIVRACAIHGPHARFSREWYFVKRALDARRAVVLAHRGEGRFHTVSVDNLAELVLHAAQRPGPRIVNGGDPDPPSVVEIGRAIAAAMNVEWTEVLLPGAEQDGVGDHPWNTPRPFVVDMTTAEIELAYRPVTTYEHAVARTVEWLVEATRGRPWEEVLPGSVDHVGPMLDYEAEDRFLASLGS
jgi:nucleoside-diphosphate-sugar epimerase